MTHKVEVWSVGGGKWRASVDWQGERLFGEANTPALAIVELGFYWEDRARNQDNDLRTLANVMLEQNKTET